MKKYLSAILVSMFIFSLSASFVFAEDENSTTSNGNRQELKNLKEEIKTARENAKSEMEKAREAAKQKMEALKEGFKKEKDQVKAKIKEARINGRQQALERFDNKISKIEELKDKVNEKIVKFETKKVDVTGAKTFVTTAETKLTEAKGKITEANTLLAGSANQLTAENKTKLRTLAQDAQTLIVEARLALGNAVKSLKDSIKIPAKETEVKE